MPTVLLSIAAGWVVCVVLFWVVVAPWLRRGPRSELLLGFLWRAVRVYARVRHRLRVTGREHLPADDADHDGLIVVANHTSAVDPFLIQAPCHFWIRWMMAKDMMLPNLDWAWEMQQVIPVDRVAGDRGALREAIRHVRGGGCVGIFPEARLVQPTGEVRPFLAGAGMVVAKTKAPVLLVWISGTPETRDMMEALQGTSRSQVTFIGRYEFGDDDDAQSITEHLRSEVLRVSGWRRNDAMLPMGDPPGRRRDDA